ncbi:MAG: AAA family ATPase, partial [Acidimicrobiia bacterium]|nr:AAA family ATPase [Acidimicrobiia bacterium]
PTTPPRHQATPRRDLLRDHVRGTQLGVDELLEVLIGDVEMVQGDWQDALEAARRNPDARFVTVGGDFVGPQGWRIGKSGSGATAVALAEANEQVEFSRTNRDQAAENVALVRSELSACGQRRTAVAQRVREAASALSAATGEQQRFVGQQRDVVTEIEALCTTQTELLARLENEQVRVEELERTKQVLENQETEHQVASERLTAALAECDSGVARATAMRGDAEMRAAAIAERQENLHSRIVEIDTRLERDALERSTAVQKRALLDRRANVYQKLAAALDAQLACIDAKLSEARQEHQQQSDAARLIVDQLNELRNKRTHLADQVEKLRDRLANAAVERAELNTRLQTLFERLRIEHNVTPDVATAVARPPLAEGVDTQQRIEQLQQKLEIMGPINPLALEECEALQQRHEFLQTQLSDITATRRDLTKVIGSIDDDIMKTFSSAFADVASNFQKLFETLFPGGHGSIRLSNPDDLLNTGIEVSARPSGKNVRKLSLLSGGERTLTALAFLFAVFRSRPSPFYVLDEVEVALDDVNLHRFLNLIEEFRADAQLVLVSHQKRTMESADCLYGVSMQPGGSSTVVSEKVGSAVSEVA